MRNVNRVTEIPSMRASKTIHNATNDIPRNKDILVTNFMTECPNKCAHQPEVFTHKDEFLIHMAFYHDEKSVSSQ